MYVQKLSPLLDSEAPALRFNHSRLFPGDVRESSCCQGAVFKKNKHGGGAGALKRKIPQWVSKFLTGSVGPHYSSLPESSLRGPTGSALIDRYILRNHWHEKRRNPTIGGGSIFNPFSFFFLYTETETPELKSKSCLAHKSSFCSNFHVHLSVHCNRKSMTANLS